MTQAPAGRAPRARPSIPASGATNRPANAARLLLAAALPVSVSVALTASLPALAAPSYVVGYASPFLTDPGQVVQVRFGRQAAAQYGITVLPPTNANGDAAKQITDIHNLVSSGAHAIVLDSTDSQAVIPAVNFAASKNVPIVAVDIPPAGGKLAMIVRSDNLVLGDKACHAMGDALHGKGKVLSLMGDQANAAGRDRTNGFNACMKASYPGITVIERPTYWKPAVATTVAQTIVTATPDLAGIYLQSDSIMLSGVLSVLRSGRRLHAAGQDGHIYLATIDGTPLALRAIRDGNVDVTINQPLDLYPKYGMYYAKAAIDGRSFKPGPTDHGSTIITVGDNLEDVLPSTTITKANVDDKSLWGNKAS